MVHFFVIRIKLKKMTIEEVPEKYRDAVRKELEKDN